VFVAEWKPRYNIAPTQLAPVVLSRERGGGRSLELLRFGLVPPYARAEAPARGKAPSMLVNARVETVTKLGAFRDAYRRRRCVVPATGFYEWMPTQPRRPKRPMWMRPPSGELLSFAAVYEPSMDEQGEVVDTFAIVTTEPTSQLRPIHDRMPLVLGPEGMERWLAGEAPSESALSGLAGEVGKVALAIVPVSSAVSSPRNDDPRCIEPTTPDDESGEQLDLF
jgi:putative SOS response-associated peptidase YedK